MARLFIDRIGEEYATGKYKIKVSKEPYKGFRMFEKIRFIDVDEIPFSYFSINKHDERGKAEYMFDYDSRKYQKPDHIEYVDVYVSKFYPTRVLIVKVCNAGVYTYYKYTDFTPNKREISILHLDNGFELEGKLSEHLISQNDKINNVTTFRIDKKESYNNINVKVKEDQKLENYTIYTHIAKEEKLKKNKSCVLYKNLLFQIDPKIQVSNDEIYYVQDIVFEEIRVYFDKEDNDIPLLVHFIYPNKRDDRNKKHFFFRKFKHEKFWKSEKIEYKEESDLQTIKDFLDKTYFEYTNLVKVFMTNKKNYTHTQNEYSQDYYLKSTRSKIIRKSEVQVAVSKVKRTTNPSDYVCYDHNFGPFFGGAQANRPEIDIFTFFISSKQITIVGENDTKDLLHTAYNHNAYVYFYKDDNFPLLVKFAKSFYAPVSKEKYFVEWEKVKNLENLENLEHLEKINPENLFKDEIIKQLDKINSMLNEIDIHKTSDYGLEYVCEQNTNYYKEDHICNSKTCELNCELKYKEIKNKQINFNRILVHRHDFDVFTSFTHFTKNEFRIGNIVYNSKNLSFNDKKISVNVGFNFVTVYFFKFDAEKENKIPLLLGYGTKEKILEYNTVKLGDSLKVVKHEFKNHDKYSQYFHKEFDRFLHHQNSVLNKVMIISLDKRENYSSCDTYVESEKSHEIIVTDVKIADDPSLHRAGYKTFRHHTGTLGKELNKNEVNLNSLFDTETYTTPMIIKHFEIYNNNIHLLNTSNKVIDNLYKVRAVYVHFYGNDPRPLLVYSGDMAFAPISPETYYTKWLQVENITDTRNERNTDESNVNVKYSLNAIIDKLEEILYILNPVYISNTCSYIIDRFEGQNIMINVNRKDLSVFRKYTHTPEENHSLGAIKFKNYSVLGDKPLYKFSELQSISAYYYKSDNDHKFPVIVELNFKNNSKIFYQLISIDPSYSWEKVIDYNLKDMLNILSLEDKDYVLKNGNFISYKFIPNEIKNSKQVYNKFCNTDGINMGTYNFKNKSFISSGYEQYDYNSAGNRSFNTSTIIDKDFHQPYESTVHGNVVGYERDTFDPERQNHLGTIYENNLVELHYNTNRPNTVFPSRGEAETDQEVPTEEGTSSRLPGVIGGVLGSVGVVGGGGFALYKFIGPGIFDMRPIF